LTEQICHSNVLKLVGFSGPFSSPAPDNVDSTEPFPRSTSAITQPQEWSQQDSVWEFENQNTRESGKLYTLKEEFDGKDDPNADHR